MRGRVTGAAREERVNVVVVERVAIVIVVVVVVVVEEESVDKLTENNCQKEQ